MASSTNELITDFVCSQLTHRCSVFYVSILYCEQFIMKIFSLGIDVDILTDTFSRNEDSRQLNVEEK
jgi:hypothetical protein